MTAFSEVRVLEVEEGVAVVQLIGEQDLATAGEIAARLDAALAAGQGIVVDLSEITFIDSTVIRTLFRCHEKLQGRGSQLVLQVHTRSPVIGILESSKLGDTVPCVPLREEAIAFASRRTP